MICKYCGRQIPEDSHVCPYCGKNLEASIHSPNHWNSEEPAENTQADELRRRAAAANQQDAEQRESASRPSTFTTEEKEAEEAPPEEGGPDQEKHRKRNRILMIVLIVLLAAIIAVVVVLAVNSGHSNGNRSNRPNQNAQSHDYKNLPDFSYEDASNQDSGSAKDMVKSPPKANKVPAVSSFRPQLERQDTPGVPDSREKEAPKHYYFDDVKDTLPDTIVQNVEAGAGDIQIMPIKASYSGDKLIVNAYIYNGLDTRAYFDIDHIELYAASDDSDQELLAWSNSDRILTGEDSDDPWMYYPGEIGYVTLTFSNPYYPSADETETDPSEETTDPTEETTIVEDAVGTTTDDAASSIDPNRGEGFVTGFDLSKPSYYYVIFNYNSHYNE